MILEQQKISIFTIWDIIACVEANLNYTIGKIFIATEMVFFFYTIMLNDQDNTECSKIDECRQIESELTKSLNSFLSFVSPLNFNSDLEKVKWQENSGKEKGRENGRHYNKQRLYTTTCGVEEGCGSKTTKGDTSVTPLFLVTQK